MDKNILDKSLSIGEFVAGAGKGCLNMVAVTLGTGMGGGAIIGGNLFTGFNYAGMEIGHHVICCGGKRCSCGRRGCFEAYCSASALIRDARDAMKHNPDSLLWKLASSMDKVDGKTLIAAVENGGHNCIKGFGRSWHYVGLWLNKPCEHFPAGNYMPRWRIGKCRESTIRPSTTNFGCRGLFTFRKDAFSFV